MATVRQKSDKKTRFRTGVLKFRTCQKKKHTLQEIPACIVPNGRQYFVGRDEEGKKKNKSVIFWLIRQTNILYKNSRRSLYLTGANIPLEKMEEGRKKNESMIFWFFRSILQEIILSFFFFFFLTVHTEPSPTCCAKLTKLIIL